MTEVLRTVIAFVALFSLLWWVGGQGNPSLLERLQDLLYTWRRAQ